MPDMLHEVIIEAPAKRVYDAITTEKGLKSWWTADAEATPEPKSIAVFGFGNRAPCSGCASTASCQRSTWCGPASGTYASGRGQD
jgi:hypothetical protein